MITTMHGFTLEGIKMAVENELDSLNIINYQIEFDSSSDPDVLDVNVYIDSEDDWHKVDDTGIKCHNIFKDVMFLCKEDYDLCY